MDSDPQTSEPHLGTRGTTWGPQLPRGAQHRPGRLRHPRRRPPGRQRSRGFGRCNAEALRGPRAALELRRRQRDQRLGRRPGEGPRREDDMRNGDEKSEKTHDDVDVVAMVVVFTMAVIVGGQESGQQDLRLIMLKRCSAHQPLQR